ncbi:uncharacterized protein G2W53_034918 [Senna tora]|uniref:Uncharacterized protein n=1 Tax=Senna tora TaxID=362788 RepID=A0A834T2M7_9FABA|nr:uncharacterized protein G2W53_034918 [Senna tora]
MSSQRTEKRVYRLLWASAHRHELAAAGSARRPALDAARQRGGSGAKG